MCGINLAVALDGGSLGEVGSDIFAAMHYANQLRGVDASGMYWRERGKTQFMKRPGAASSFLRPREYRSYLRDSVFAVGHTRAATLGGADDAKAAHPFNPGNVIGVHNGTINGWRSYFKEVSSQAVNDSDALYRALAEVGPDEATSILERITLGAYALVWYDFRAKELRLARNEERPIWLTERSFFRGVGIARKEHKFLFGASEPGFIANAIAHGVSLPETYKDISCISLKPSVMMSISLETGETSVTPYKDRSSGAADAYDYDYPGWWERNRHRAIGSSNRVATPATGRARSRSGGSLDEYEVLSGKDKLRYRWSNQDQDYVLVDDWDDDCDTFAGRTVASSATTND